MVRQLFNKECKTYGKFMMQYAVKNEEWYYSFIRSFKAPP